MCVRVCVCEAVLNFCDVPNVKQAVVLHRPGLIMRDIFKQTAWLPNVFSTLTSWCQNGGTHDLLNDAIERQDDDV